MGSDKSDDTNGVSAITPPVQLESVREQVRCLTGTCLRSFAVDHLDNCIQVVPKVHKVPWQKFIEELELCPLRHTRGFWTFDRVCDNLLEYARRSGAPSLLPTQDELDEASLDASNPLQFLAKGLAVQVFRIGKW